MARDLRYAVEPKDISPEKAARRLGLDHDRFLEVLPRLLMRGFPAADADTGNFDLDAIDEWRKRRHANLFGLTKPAPALDASNVVMERLARARLG